MIRPMAELKLCRPDSKSGKRGNHFLCQASTLMINKHRKKDCNVYCPCYRPLIGQEIDSAAIFEIINRFSLLSYDPAITLE